MATHRHMVQKAFVAEERRNNIEIDEPVYDLPKMTCVRSRHLVDRIDDEFFRL